MADKTIGALPAVPEAAIGDLPSIAELYDNDLLAVEQQGDARKMTGRQWKIYAQAAVKKYVDDAQKAADDAMAAVGQVGTAVADTKANADRADAAAKKAEQYSGKPPIIQNGTWWTWNADKQVYLDTGEAARGNLMYATFYLDARSGFLYMLTDPEYTGPQFRLTGGDLEVVLNYGG